MEELQLLNYTGALTTSRIYIHTRQRKSELTDTQKKSTISAWQHRLQKRIEKLRKDIGQLTQIIQNKI